jgi:glutathione synthase/RimK-type ligase-like ATP-grasp enzyme
MHKFYLQQLQSKGIDVIPTIFINKGAFDLSIVIEKGWDKVVIKPAVSAGAYLTRLFNIADIERVKNEMKDIGPQHDWLLQPYVPEVNVAGELSLLFFNKQYSHAVIKTPKQGDFRVQQQHGGITTAYTPDAGMLYIAQQILTQISDPLLYARVDGVVINGKFTLMELELVEPYLFFDYQSGSIEKFVQETVRMINL